MIRIPWDIKPPRGVQLDRSHPLVRHLVGCWLLNEATGEVVHDFTGNNHGQFAGTAFPTWVPEGLANPNDNTNSRVNLGSITSDNPLSLYQTDNYTIVTRVWVPASHTTYNLYPYVFAKNTGGGSAGGFVLCCNAGVNDWYIGCNSSSDSLGVINHTAWNFLVCGRDRDGNAFLYQDGGTKITGSSLNAPTSTTANASIANWATSTDREWCGTINFVYVFDRELTHAEATALYNNPYQIFESIRIPIVLPTGAIGGIFHLVAEGSGIGFSQNILEVGATYKYSIEITEVVSGGIQLKHGSTVIATYTTTGIKTGTFTASSVTFSIVSSEACDITFDNIDITQILALSITQYAPSILTDIDVVYEVPAPLSLSFTINQEATSVDCTVNANLQTLTVTNLSESVSVDCLLSPNTQVLNLAVLQETVVASCTIPANLLNLTLTQYAESTSSDCIHTASLQTLSISNLAESIRSDCTYNANLLNINFNSLGEVVSIGSSVTPTSQSLSLSVYPPTYRMDVNWTASLQTMTITIWPETIQTGNDLTVNAGLQTLSITQYPDTLDITCTYLANAQALTLTQYGETTRSDCTHQASLLTLNIGVLAETVSTDATVTPSVQSLSVIINLETVSIDAEVLASPQALTITNLAELVVIEVGSTVYPTCQSLNITTHEELVRTDCVIPAGTQALTLTYLQESALIETVIPAGLQTLNVSVNGVSVRTDVAIQPSLMTLAIIQFAEVPSVSVSATATLQTLTTNINSAILAIDTDVSAAVQSITLVQYQPTVTAVSPADGWVYPTVIPMVISTHHGTPLNVTFGRVASIEFTARAPSASFDSRCPEIEFDARAPVVEFTNND